jgi:hypothetical protein
MRTIFVPEQYRTIQAAVNAAEPGGVTIVVAKGVHSVTDPNGIDFRGKSLILASANPDDPNVVANTIIDCQGDRYNPRRAFHFHSGEDPNVVVAGFTIRNGYIRPVKGIAGQAGVPTPDPYERTGPQANDPPRAERGDDATGNGYGGAILCENGSSPTIKNCVIENCTVTGAHGGDGAVGTSTTPQAPQWTYIPPVAAGEVPQPQQTGDGQWGGHGGTGTGNGYGGAIACRGGSSPRIIGCALMNNAARGGCGGDGGNGGSSTSGGAESWGGNGGSAIGDGIGGGIYAENGSAPVVVDCNFVGNRATTGAGGPGGRSGSGGALAAPRGPAGPGLVGPVASNGGIVGGAGYYNQASASFVNCVFAENSATANGFVGIGLFAQILLSETQTRGGALYCQNDSSTYLKDCRFIENLGGAVYIASRCPVDVNGCLFENNESLSYDGGALRVGQNCDNVVVANSSFYGNSSYSNGGAVKLMSDADFVNCWFGGNEAGGNGGAVDGWYLVDPNDPSIVVRLEMSFTGCGFIGNRAVNGYYGWGGGLHIQDFNAVFTDCYFFENNAKNGGALFMSDGTARLIGGVVHRNKAVGGSSMDTSVPFDLMGRFGVSRSPDLSGSNDTGGGIVCSNVDVRIENYRITDNVVQGVWGSGGGISLYGGLVGSVMKNCLLVGNSANKQGGGIFSGGFSVPQISNCTFVANKAGKMGAAIFSDWSSNVIISDSIFKDCNAVAIVEEDEAGDVVKYSIFNNNRDGDYGVYDFVADLMTKSSGTSLDGSNKAADPLFVKGPLGDYYLSQVASGQGANSPAVNAGSKLSLLLGLMNYTTRTDSGKDMGQVDIGYHYVDHTKLARYNLRAGVVGGHGLVEPTSGNYYAGTAVTIVAKPERGYRVAKWTGTVNDYSRVLTNFVVMDRDKDVTVRFDQPRMIVVGSDPNYTSIERAIDAAVDGDIVVVPTDRYTPPNPDSTIEISKPITLTSTNPNDPCCVAATVLNGYSLAVSTVDGEAIIDGITIRSGTMGISSCSPTVRNCVFVECRWVGYSPGNPTNFPDDGYNGYSVEGGAMHITNGSPTVQNCRFEGCSVTGGNGGPGDGGVTGHEEGFDGGWAGWAYGGAVYMGYASNPVFVDCSFINCFAQGGNGGDGGNGINNALGGRGGNWAWNDSDETGAGSAAWFWWDGWQYGGYYADGLSRASGNVTETGVGAPYDFRFKDYWKYSGHGGAVYCENESSPKFYNCTFERNTAYGGVSGIGGTLYGGSAAIDVNGVIHEAYNGPERRIKIENFGGALYACQGSNAEFYNCKFTDNLADTFVDPNVVTIPDDILVSFGGSLAFEDDCRVKFVGCTITDSNACVGGGVYWSDSDITIIDCNVTENVGYQGGGMYSLESDSTILESRISRNAAWMDPWADWNDVNNYDPNYFGQGGGYHCRSSDVLIKDTLFARNRANSSGGGLYLAGISNSLSCTALLHNCLMHDNIAGRDGGAVSANWFSEPLISNCTIVNNIVPGYLGTGGGLGGGICFSYDSNSVLINSILWGNRGGRGSQIALGVGAVFQQRPHALRVSYSDVQGWVDVNNPGRIDANAVFVDANCPLIWDFNSIIDADPNFVKGFYLSQTAAGQVINSAAVDAGSADANDPAVALAQYTTRTDGVFDSGHVDLGYHYKKAAPPRGYYAVVVGVADYVGIVNDLLYTADDANDMYHALLDSLNWSSSNVTLLVDSNATKDNIRSAIADMGTRMTPDDVFLFYFSGHGTIGADLDPNDEADGFDEYLVTYDLVDNVRDDELGQWLAELPTKNYIVLLDACYSGGHIESANNTFKAKGLGKAVPWPGDGFEADLRRPRRYLGVKDLDDYDTGVVLSACADGSLSLESPEIEHSVFTYFILEGMRVQADLDSNSPNGWVSAEELFKYIQPRIREWVLQREIYGLQETQIYDSHVGDLDFYDYDQNDLVQLTTAVVGSNGNIVPGSGSHVRYEVVDLTALPDVGYRVKEWTGTQDDTIATRRNRVIMDANRRVTVSFDQPVTMAVPGQYPYTGLGAAIDRARDGDTIIVAPGTYRGVGYWIRNKEITITSTNPDDANVVANTIIDCQGELSMARGFWFAEGSGRSVLNGFTIRNAMVAGLDGDVNDPSAGSMLGRAVVVGYGTSPTISNCVIEGSQLSGGNGLDADPNDPNGFGLAGNGGGVGGGGIFVAANSHPTIRNCVVRDCTVIGGNGGNASATGFGWGAPGGNGGWARGGGIYIGEDSDAVLAGVRVINCSAVAGDGGNGGSSLIGGDGGWSGHAQGGGIYCGPRSKPTFIDCVVTDCNVVGGDGGNGGNGLLYYWTGGYGGSWSADDEWLYHGAQGGGMYCDAESRPSFTSCSINNNTVSGGLSGLGGLGLAGIQAQPTTNYDVPSLGGGLFFDANSVVAITDCNVSGNTTVFKRNQYTGYGGGIYCRGVISADIVDCNVSDNSSPIGGGLYALGSSLDVQDSNFVENAAYVGGGVLTIKGKANIARSVINGNTASPLADPNTTFDPNNIAAFVGILFGSGGGLYSFETDALIADSVITRNAATGSGGGIYVAEDSNSMQVRNCLITHNMGTRDGGGISVNWYAKAVVANCTFVGNASPGVLGEPNRAGVGGGLYCSYYADCKVVNSIFWENYAPRGHELAVGAGFEHDPRPSKLTVSHSDVMNGKGEVEVEKGCTLVWGSGNIDKDPLFVTSTLGDYYLSQRDAGQGQTSPCVDTGSGYASEFDMVGYTTRTDEVPDTGTVDMGYHHPTAEPCRFCDVAFDGIINFKDFAMLAERWLTEGCSSQNAWCDGVDVTFDTRVNMRDVAFMADCWLATDNQPPIPDPARWFATGGRPYLSSGSTVTMTAETAYDAWGWDVEYYFECVFGNCHDSGWRASPAYTDSGLAAGHRYGYRVRARDTSPYHNMTEWSDTGYAGADDTTPPAPAPGWSLRPRALSLSSIEMRATPSFDDSGVQYYFECVSGNGHHSGWQASPSYTDTGLDPNTEYCYRVRARDMSSSQNLTVWSDVACVRTPLPTDTTPPTPNPMQWNPTLDPNNFNGEPREIFVGPTQWDYAATMTAVVAVDLLSPPVEYSFECVDNSGFNSGWQLGNTYTVLVGRSGQALRFWVRARDAIGNTTDYSPKLPTRPVP